MNVFHVAQEIQTFLTKSVFTTPESKVAAYIERQTVGIDPIELYAHCCKSFSRSVVQQVFIYSGCLWSRFDLGDLTSLLGHIHPRPLPVWAWDGGEYGDVTFFVRTVNLNIFFLTKSPTIDWTDARRILEYGVINSELLLQQVDDEDVEEEEDDDPYYDSFLTSVRDLREVVLGEDPSLDIKNWTSAQLEESIRSIHRTT